MSSQKTLTSRSLFFHHRRAPSLQPETNRRRRWHFQPALSAAVLSVAPPTPVSLPQPGCRVQWSHRRQRIDGTGPTAPSLKHSLRTEPPLLKSKSIATSEKSSFCKSFNHVEFSYFSLLEDSFFLQVRQIQENSVKQDKKSSAFGSHCLRFLHDLYRTRLKLTAKHVSKNRNDINIELLPLDVLSRPRRLRQERSQSNIITLMSAYRRRRR